MQLVGVGRYLVPVDVPLERLLLHGVEEVLRHRRQLLPALRDRRVVVVVQDVLGALPEYYLLAHYFLAIIAQVLQRRLIAAAWWLRNWFSLGIALAVVFKFDADIKAIDGEAIEILVRVLRADLPPVDLDQVVVADERRVERYPEYFAIARDLARILKDNHDVAVEDHRLADYWQVDFYVFVAIVSPNLI